MAKQVDSTNIGTLLEALITKVKSFFWRKEETDSTPTSASDNLVRSGGVFSALSEKYTKPANGIPASDLAPGVIPTVPTDMVKYTAQTLTDAQKAQARTNIGAGTYSKPSSGIPAGDLANGVIPDVSQFITKSVDNLENYYKKAETYNKTEVDTGLSGKQEKIDAQHKLDYSLLSNTPSIPAAQVPADWEATTGVSRILNKPTIPAAPVNADWNATEGLAKILNKPSIPAGQVPSDWNATEGVSRILNKPTVPTQYAGSPSAGGPANKALAIPFGEVVEGSTDTALLATVDNFPDTLTAGVFAYVRNNRVASASGWTLNINGTGAKPVYASNADATRTTTIFSAAVTYLFIYNPTRVEGGCWDMYYGYNANDNTIGYNLRTNAMSLPVTSACYRYRLLFTSADGTHFVPANASTSTNATSKRTTTQTKIDPFGSIRYYSSTSAVSSGARPGATSLWEQYLVTLGYSFNRTGAALTLTPWKPVYIKCTPQADGSAIIEEETPYVQDLPTTADGKIYIFLGVATSATQVEVVLHNPVYYYKFGRIRIWNGIQPTEFWNIPVDYRDNNAKVTLPEYNINDFPQCVFISFNNENQTFFDLTLNSYIALLHINIPAGYFARFIAIGDASVYFEPVDATSFKVNGITFTYNSGTGNYETDQWPTS